MTTNKNRKSFIPIHPESDFTLHNIPFGIFRSGNKTGVASRIGDHIIDLEACKTNGIFDGIDLPVDTLTRDTLNDFIALGKSVTSAVRARIIEVFAKGGSAESIVHPLTHAASEVEMLLPIQIGDYTDFYSSIEHARNVGTMFRDPKNALMPNWKHLPVGYHGRASSIIVSDTPVKRPHGQQKPNDQDNPVYGPSRLLDFELEMGFVIGKSTNLGETVSTENAEDHIFGLILVNDWSARDIQKWEYVPLGPFLGKSFATTVSPWIITMDALEPFRTEGPVQEPEVLPYLQYSGKKNYDVNLSVDIISESGAKKTVCVSNFKYMYWNMCQQLAHHTVNGCNINVGDMYASGTISGPTPDSFGSMLEITWRGSNPVEMPDGSQRKFIANGDTVLMKGWCEKEGIRIGFGDCAGKVVS